LFKTFEMSKRLQTPESILYQDSIQHHGAQVSDSGALVVRTGTFTGRSPKDRYIVRDAITDQQVWWGSVNQPISTGDTEVLESALRLYLSDKEPYERYSYLGWAPEYQISVHTVCEYPWSDLFVRNMMIQPTEEQLSGFAADWTVLCAPGFEADPTIHGVARKNFTILNFSKKLVLIGGSGYTGEIKKGMFSALNFLYPTQSGILPMHCSANEGQSGDVALFFGLSGTGKTTLSTAPDRSLIGDDEHGWTADGQVFNFEGGCYAKVIDLNADKEPEIFRAIKQGALLENLGLNPDGSPQFTDRSITENTRVSYPLNHIPQAKVPAVGATPKTIFFLTADATGVLPPLAQLTPSQAAYYFICGYTSKIAGTEQGITEPVPNFSACFGAPFMPLHPVKYAQMLSEHIAAQGVQVWLVNTGWIQGGYGVGPRIPLKYTRALIQAVLDGYWSSKDHAMIADPVFGFKLPDSCPGIPSEVLHPDLGWSDAAALSAARKKLAGWFNNHFAQFSADAPEELIAAGPRI